MAILFDKLPTILVLAVMVGIFVALRRHVKSPRLHLWIGAWVLIFVHFFVQVFEPADGNLTPLTFMIDLGSLQLSALCFVASLTSFFEDTRLTFCLLDLDRCCLRWLTPPGWHTNSNWRWLYISSAAIIFYGTPLFVVLRRKVVPTFFVWAPIVAITGTVAMVRAWHGALQSLVFWPFLRWASRFPGFLFYRRYPRWSPGVVTSAGGFLLWGAVFPVGQMMDVWAPNLKINPELWNTPKFFVAFGMILTLLEDKSDFLRSARRREQKLNRQLQKFSGITSRLLSGVEINSVCGEMAAAIRETSTFDRVVIILSPDGRNLFCAGHAGYEGDAKTLIEHKCNEVWKFEDMVEACTIGQKLGERSIILRPEQMEKYGQVPSDTIFKPSPHWVKGNHVLVPLRSMRGAHVGCIGLSDPRDVTPGKCRRVNQDRVAGGRSGCDCGQCRFAPPIGARGKAGCHGPACCRCCP